MKSMHAFENAVSRGGLLYPTLVIASIAVIVFSVVGVATMMGWMPSALSGNNPAATSTSAPSPASDASPVVPAEPVRVAEGPASSSGVAGPAPAAAPAAPTVDCPNCGVIESIRAVEVKGNSTWMGAGGGAAVGALLGSQIGHGTGRMVAGAVGAGAGAYAGTQVEQHLRKSVKYQVRIRMENGTTRTFYRTRPPAFAVGQKVRITDRGIVDADTGQG